MASTGSKSDSTRRNNLTSPQISQNACKTNVFEKTLGYNCAPIQVGGEENSLLSFRACRVVSRSFWIEVINVRFSTPSKFSVPTRMVCKTCSLRDDQEHFCRIDTFFASSYAHVRSMQLQSKFLKLTNQMLGEC